MCKSLRFGRGLSPTLMIKIAYFSTTGIFHYNQKIFRSCMHTNLELIFDNSIPRLGQGLASSLIPWHEGLNMRRDVSSCLHRDNNVIITLSFQN